METLAFIMSANLGILHEDKTDWKAIPINVH